MFPNFYQIFCIDFYRLLLIIKNLHNIVFQKVFSSEVQKKLLKFSTMNFDETLLYYRLVCLHRQMHFMVLIICVMHGLFLVML